VPIYVPAPIDPILDASAFALAARSSTNRHEQIRQPANIRVMRHVGPRQFKVFGQPRSLDGLDDQDIRERNSWTVLAASARSPPNALGKPRPCLLGDPAP
jgi:hypothetical protein